MGVDLNRPAEGTVGWHSSIDSNWSTLESQYVARQESDTSIVTVTGTSSETVLIANAIPANALAAGVVLAVYCAGTITVPASTTETPTWRLRWGGISGPVLWTSAGFTYTVGAGGSGSTGWGHDVRIVCVSAGASGSVETQGFSFTGGGTIASGAGATWVPANTAAVTVDTTTAKDLVLTIQVVASGCSTSQRVMVTNRG